MPPPAATPQQPAPISTTDASVQAPLQRLGRYNVGVSASVAKAGPAGRVPMAGGWMPRNSIVRDALQVIFYITGIFIACTASNRVL